MNSLRLGTRGSPLALIQAQNLRDKLIETSPDLANGIIEVVPIKTSGDWRPEQRERTFLEMGADKGLFTKEIEEALLAGYIDMAIHSMKDVPSLLPDGLEIAALLERDDPRDAFISAIAPSLKELPKGASVGTSSIRRQAQILAFRSDLKVTALRGNVDTRLRKLTKGDADATVLALAGMRRLGLETSVTSVIETTLMLPSPGQGAIAVETRVNDAKLRPLLALVNHRETEICITAERAFLRAVEGSCQTPIGALARLSGKKGLTLEVLAARGDGSSVIREIHEGSQDQATDLGYAAGESLKSRLPADFFARPF